MIEEIDKVKKYITIVSCAISTIKVVALLCTIMELCK
jgi:hypothetical protein